MFRHIVLVRVKREVSQDLINEVFTSIGDLQDKISGILDFKWGQYEGSEGLNDGLNYGFTTDFEDKKSYDHYLPHPEHEKVKDKLLAILDSGAKSVIVFDFKY